MNYAKTLTPLLCILFFLPCYFLEAQEPGLGINLPRAGEALPVSAFGEVWVYVVAGNEAALRPGLPITDVGYFGAEINMYGALISVPDRRNLPAFSGRVHLVVGCNGRALTYFTLKPGSEERRALIAGLLAAARNFDGLQIDFEQVPPRSGEAYISFLRELREGLGGKTFSVALAARTRKLENDVYDYERIAPLVDRILVMAYDEHWGGGPPGPVASLAWCRRVAQYSMQAVGREKLIMGIPFYGRGWVDRNHHHASIYTTVERIIREHNVTDIQRENGIPTFSYSPAISVRVYYEDAYSLAVRMAMYRSMGVTRIGFWRIGQETPEVWRYIRLSN